MDFNSITGNFPMAHTHWIISVQDYNTNTSDSITFTDIISKDINRFLNIVDSTVQFTESAGKNIGKSVSDAITVSEGLSKSIKHYVSDALSIVEDALNTGGKPQPLDLQFVDTITKTITKVIQVSDSILSNEFSGKTMIRSVSDNILITESSAITTYRNFVKSIIDTLNMGDNISKSIARHITDTPGMVENLTRGIMRMVNDGIISVESISLNITSLLLEQSRTIRPIKNNNIDAEGTLVSI